MTFETSQTNGWSVRFVDLYISGVGNIRFFPISCARACTVASEVPTEAQFFADCKLHIRTRLLASASSTFWKTLFRNFIYCIRLVIPGMASFPEGIPECSMDLYTLVQSAL